MMDFYEIGCVEFNDLAAYAQMQPLIDSAVWTPAEHGGWQAEPEDNVELFAQMESLFERLANDYLTSHFAAYQLRRTYVMKGYDGGSTKWHNDTVEGHNLTLVLHMRALSEETGGLFEMQNTITGAVRTFIPKPGAVLMFSHQSSFNHRVVPLKTDAERIAIFFDCIAY